LVTVTFTAPDACGGVVTVIELELVTLMPVPATPPNLTVAPLANPVPPIVTAVPPAVDPLAGVTDVAVGAGGGALP
jgi:hypothetical protein